VLNPYRGAADVKGKVAFVLASTVNGERGVVGLDLAQREVVTTNHASYFRIAARQPAAIVFASDSDFEKSKGTGATHAELLTKGTIRRVRSANLVATTRDRKAGGEIILSAHIDSAGTPGAQGNASGVAVLLDWRSVCQGWICRSAYVSCSSVQRRKAALGPRHTWIDTVPTFRRANYSSTWTPSAERTSGSI